MGIFDSNDHDDPPTNMSDRKLSAVESNDVTDDIYTAALL